MSLQINSVVNEINEIVKNNLIFRFESELTDLDKNISENKDINKDNILNRKSSIIKILNNLKHIPEKNVNLQVLNKNKYHDYLDKITSNKFKQSWAKLNMDQRYTKIEEYINKSNYTKKKKIIKHLKDMLFDGKLSSSKIVTYDKSNATILSIRKLDEIIENLFK
jgi:hypothetical protein